MVSREASNNAFWSSKTLLSTPHDAFSNRKLSRSLELFVTLMTWFNDLYLSRSYLKDFLDQSSP